MSNVKTKRTYFLSYYSTAPLCYCQQFALIDIEQKKEEEEEQ